MANNKETNESEPKLVMPQEEPQFKSGFKSWIRVVAFIVIAVFLPEQVAQAAQYDWRVLWQRSTPAAFIPPTLKDKNLSQADIPLAVRGILNDISGKPIKTINISPTVAIELEKPLNISKERIDQIYNWLQGRPCGSKALYDLLTYSGIQAAEQDIAVMALTIDILNNVTKPEGNPKVIKTSLYALSKASEFFGLKLYPVKLDFNSISKSITPFIAHLQGEHYILVNRITDDKVYYIDEHKEEFLPKERFLKDFSEYALISNPTSDIEILSEKEAKEILGAGITTDDNYVYDNGWAYEKITLPWFKGIGITDALLGLGMTVGMGLLTGGAGGMLSGIYASQFSTIASNFAIAAGADPRTAMLVGMGAGGFASGGLSGSGVWSWSGALKGMGMGALQGATTIGLQAAFQGHMPDSVAAALAGLGGMALPGMTIGGISSMKAGTGFWHGVGSFWVGSDPVTTEKQVTKEIKPGEQGAWESITTDSNGKMWGTYTIKTTIPGQTAFLPYAIGQTAGALFEWLAISKGWMSETNARILGVSISSFGAGFSNLIPGLPKVDASLSSIIKSSLLSAGVGVGLSALGGEFDRQTGVNKWGLTPLQMSGVQFMGTALVASGVSALVGQPLIRAPDLVGSPGSGAIKEDASRWDIFKYV
ncbi:MAG: cysteine peptidase family C39 domain-containing protein, partial [Deltaproteobacteria bacterium]